MAYTAGRFHQDESISNALDDVARAHRILELEGHGDMSMGHISYRDPFGRGLWLKRGNLALSEVEGNDFVLIDFDGTMLEGTGLRHLEWPLHAEIMRARSDVHFVGHSHAHYATVFGATDQELGPFNNHGVWFADHGVPRFSDTSQIVTTVELGVEVARQLGDAEAILLKNHGIAFVGDDVAEMMLAGIFLEWASKFQLDLLSTGVTFDRPDHEESVEKRRRIYPPKAQRNYWMYFNRKLDRVEALQGIGIAQV
ncbi:class II aldolase/adducin family protein [uncultured Amnibacterium sp.]|uniref:class II aldolase/adducin family protein n=1 Tax=uncultured Amnibacterium sp. TaxID=1631851 RepID=UPI0035C9E717